MMTFKEFWERYINEEDVVTVILKGEGDKYYDRTFHHENMLSKYDECFDTSLRVETATIHPVEEYNVTIVSLRENEKPNVKENLTDDKDGINIEVAVEKFKDAMTAASEKIAESIRAAVQSIQSANISTPNVTYGPTPPEIHFEPIDDYCIDDIPDTIIGHEEKMKSEIIDKEYKVNEE